MPSNNQILSAIPVHKPRIQNPGFQLHLVPDCGTDFAQKGQQIAQDYQEDWEHVYGNMIGVLGSISQCVGVRSLKVMVTPAKVGDVSRGLSPIGFVSLKTLVLSNNKLQSIQFINLLFLPNLQQLNLNGNNLTSLKPLRKLSTNGCTNLQLLHIHNNRFPSLNPCQSHITSLPFNAYTSTQCLNLQQTSKLYYGDDINWLFKLPCRGVFRLEIDGSGRIPVNRRKFNMVESRFRGGGEGFFMWGPKLAGQPYNPHYMY